MISNNPQVSPDFHSSPEMVRFNAALRKVVRVSKSKLNRLLAEDRITPLAPQKRGRKPKILASAPASPGKG
jgi:hypothetical protein